MGGKSARTTHIAGGAANAALMLATAGLAAAYAPRGVRINAVNPGLTLTERLQQGLQAEARQRNTTVEEALQDAERAQPLGRIARPEEIADAVVWLASARASYVSGAILAMDGAMTPII
jgi:NAD(P)-dependent dehydrogenase (short-subunit alcohol dehydrogenase family)